ncbi:polysaccharide biosynthesis/export family protein [Roseivirga sp. BDSF3-8]|uniref:polysaccharide biosynthesis/export family protein n=1 Tax=Roseivirga sp. BDSF3-8 TaxID=3241598 RepID=UPI003531FBA8
MKRFLFGLIIMSVAFACVPNKKLIYLQSQGIDDADKVTTDSVLKVVDLAKYKYKLQPGDIVSIKISSLTDPKFNFFAEAERELKEGIDPSLSGFMLDDRGFVELPVAGKVSLTGLTLEEAQDKVREVAQSYLESPTVNLRLLSFHFTILGEVNVPGNYTTYSGRYSIMDAIGQAGDLTDLADRKRIKVIRYDQGQAKVYFMDLLDAETMSSPLFYLQPNDLVYVSPLKVKNFTQFQSRNIALVLSIITSLSLIFFRF